MPTGTTNQFRDLFFHGTPLHECIYCGEVPQSMGAAKASTGPAEPRSRESTGRNTRPAPTAAATCWSSRARIGPVGWKFACLDCDWEIKQAELLDVKE